MLSPQRAYVHVESEACACTAAAGAIRSAIVVATRIARRKVLGRKDEVRISTSAVI
jgi:hypothetical protein